MDLGEASICPLDPRQVWDRFRPLGWLNGETPEPVDASLFTGLSQSLPFCDMASRMQTFARWRSGLSLWVLLTLLSPWCSGVTLNEAHAPILTLFPEADQVGPVEGTPPLASLKQGDRLVGYALLTDQITPIPAYSGKPIATLVVFDVAGKIRGVRVLAHQEPILVVGVSDEDLARYTGQYADLFIADDVRVGGSPAPGRPVIDGITGATITTMVINSAVVRSLHQVIQARGLLTAAHQDALRAQSQEPLWSLHWRERTLQIAGISAGLLLLLLILLFQDWLARRPNLLNPLRTLFLVYTLVFIGGYALGQLSIVNVLTFTSAITSGFSWESFLVDPVLFLLWSFVAMTLLLWGRGVYCGWLCPFGALQELAYRFARQIRLPSIEPPSMLHERLLALKYLILLGLFGISLQSLRAAELLAEVEPFKTVFTLRFHQEWPFVAYALGLLAVGLFVRKFFCRYLCPLGAALTFPSRFRIFEWLRRRRECGQPCQLCAVECEVQAIRPTGEINDRECHYCLDCQVTYWNDHKCPPLVDKRKKRELRTKLQGIAQTTHPSRPPERPTKHPLR